MGLGVLILWFGWYGLAVLGGGTGVSGSIYAFGRSAMNTTLAAAAACGAGIMITKLVTGSYSVVYALSSTLAGLVSIGASCTIVKPWAAIIIGVIGAFIYVASSRFLKSVRLDDPMDAAAIHGFTGIWGLLAAGLFGWADLLDPTSDAIATGRQFGMQLLGGLIIAAWTVATSGILFFLLNRTIGLRDPAETDPDAALGQKLADAEHSTLEDMMEEISNDPVKAARLWEILRSSAMTELQHFVDERAGLPRNRSRAKMEPAKERK